MSRTEGFLYGVTGLHRATEISRFIFLRQFNGAFFAHRDKTFKELPDPVRRFLQHNAMTEADWDNLRAEGSLWREDTDKGFTIESKLLEKKSPETHRKWTDILRNQVDQSVATGGAREGLSRLGMPFSRRGKWLPFIFAPVQQGTLMSAFVLNPMYYLGGAVLRLTHNLTDVIHSKSMTGREKGEYYLTVLAAAIATGLAIEHLIAFLKGETPPEIHDEQKGEFNAAVIGRVIARGNVYYPFDFLLHLGQSGPQSATVGSIATDRTPYLNVYNTISRLVLRTSGDLLDGDFNPYRSIKDVANIVPFRNVWWFAGAYRMFTDSLAITSDRRGRTKYRRSLRARKKRGLPIPYRQFEAGELW